MTAEPDLLPCPFGYVEPRHDLSGYEVCDDPGPRRAAIWNLAGIEEAMRRATAAKDAEVEALRAEVALLRVGAENERLHQRGLLDRERERAERLAEALRYAVEQVPELATVPGIAALLHPTAAQENDDA